MRNMSSVSLPGVAALRALAHPARLDLLDLLRVHEKLTAAECARLLGTSTKSCSYHLGILAGQGLVARADEPAADGRERPWCRVADEIVTATPRTRADREARAALMLATARRELELFAGFLDHEPGQSADWRDAITLHTRAAVMSADQLRAWGMAVEALTREHVGRSGAAPAAGARPVRLTIRGFPQQLPPVARDSG
jgi:DNA-binding transcriptional ArsR family regulator